MNRRRLPNRLAGDRLVRVVDAQITRIIGAAYNWLLICQIEYLAQRFRDAADEVEQFARERRGDAA